MRLTLRTMLAYLDDVLEPSDAQELENKINESEYANDLVQRIRGSMKKLRLDAPALEGKNMGLDPNTVAEYLDSTLPNEQTPDFEKVCLDKETDIHLAEVAACHQILALVLGESPDIPTPTRERIYRIGSPLVSDQTDASAEEKTEEKAEEVAQPPLAEPPQQDSQQPEAPPRAGEKVKSDQGNGERSRSGVPDYLREGRRRNRTFSIAMTLVVLLLIVGGAVMAIGVDETIEMLGFQSAEVAQSQPTESGEVPKTTTDTDEAAAASIPGTVLPLEPAIEPLTPAVPEVGPSPTILPESPTSPGPVESEPLTALNDPGLAIVDPPVTVPIAPPALPVDPTATTNPAVPSTTPDPIEEEPAQPAAITLGQYTSEMSLLSRFSVDDDHWQPLAPRTTIASGDDFLVLPTYRPQLMLKTGVHLTIVGGARFKLTADQAEAPQVQMTYGRLLVSAASKPDTEVILHVGSKGTLHLSTADSEVAVEYSYRNVPGADPRKATTIGETRFYAIKGEAQWRPTTGAVLPLGPGQVTVIAGEAAPVESVAKESPKWVQFNHLSDIDRRASATLAPLVVPGRPLTVSLDELATDRRVEIRSLVIRSLTHLGQFDRSATALGDIRMKSYWGGIVKSLQQAIARSSEEATAVSDALTRLPGGREESLFQLLWGYDNQSLQAGAAAKLVEYLESDKIEYRVLAIENLTQITGSNLLYRPETSTARRQNAVNRWNQELADGKILYK